MVTSLIYTFIRSSLTLFITVRLLLLRSRNKLLLYNERNNAYDTRDNNTDIWTKLFYLSDCWVINVPWLTLYFKLAFIMFLMRELLMSPSGIQNLTMISMMMIFSNLINRLRRQPNQWLRGSQKNRGDTGVSIGIGLASRIMHDSPAIQIHTQSKYRNR